jgi:predicted GTPase
MTVDAADSGAFPREEESIKREKERGTAYSRELAELYPKHTRVLRGKLLPLMDKVECEGKDRAQPFAKTHLIQLNKDGIRVAIVPRPDTTTASLANSLASEGVRVEQVTKTSIEAVIPLEKLKSVPLSVKGVDYIHIPEKLVPQDPAALRE